MANRDKLVVILSTFPKRAPAEKAARTLVEEELAACAWVLSKMNSFYHWQGKLVSDREHLMVIKTRESLVKAVEGRLHELHPYAVPEFLVVPASYVAKEYWDWALSVTRGDGGARAGRRK